MRFIAWDEDTKTMYHESTHIFLDMNGKCINMHNVEELEPFFTLGTKNDCGNYIYNNSIQ